MTGSMNMQLSIADESSVSWSEYASIPSAFEVRSELALGFRENGLAGVSLRECAVSEPWLKDYDALEGGPLGWSLRFDTKHWGRLVATADGQRVGGAVVVHDQPNIDMLEGRADLSLVWDLRVAPAWRGRGVGRRLFAAAELWARERGCRELKVETQNVNVAACRFYASAGCRLGVVNRSAYPQLPDEVQLVWFKKL